MAARSRRQYVTPGSEGQAEPEAEGDFEPGGRSFWSGTLSFGLVTVPVSLYSAQRSTHSSLRMLAADGTPLVRRFFCPADESWVDSEHVVRGYEIAEGEYITVTDEELDALAPEKSHDIVLRQFVDASAIPPALFEHAYVLGPRGEAVRAYRLLATAMERSGKAGIATFVMHGKEYLVAIFASQGLLRAETLRFADELRSPDEIGLPPERQVDSKRVRTLRHAIERKSRADFNPNELEQGYWARVEELVAKKEARGRDVIEVEAAEAERGADVVDLMAELKKSLAATKPSKGRATRAAKSKNRTKKAARRASV